MIKQKSYNSSEPESIIEEPGVTDDSNNILYISTTIPNEPEPVYETAVEGINQLNRMRNT